MIKGHIRGHLVSYIIFLIMTNNVYQCLSTVYTIKSIIWSYSTVRLLMNVVLYYFLPICDRVEIINYFLCYKFRSRHVFATEKLVLVKIDELMYESPTWKMIPICIYLAPSKKRFKNLYKISFVLLLCLNKLNWISNKTHWIFEYIPI